MDENCVGAIVVDQAVNLHKAMGPGLLEAVYEVVLAKQLEKAGLSVRRQVAVPIVFEGLKLSQGFRADIIVNDLVILEPKSVEKVLPVRKKQLLTYQLLAYLKLTQLKLGYLLNFGDELMKKGITRIINGQL